MTMRATNSVIPAQPRQQRLASLAVRADSGICSEPRMSRAPSAVSATSVAERRAG